MTKVNFLTSQNGRGGGAQYFPARATFPKHRLNDTTAVSELVTGLSVQYYWLNRQELTPRNRRLSETPTVNTATEAAPLYGNQILITASTTSRP